MSWKDDMDAAIVKWLQANVHTEAEEFIGFGEQNFHVIREGCSTCDYGREAGFELELIYTAKDPGGFADDYAYTHYHIFDGEFGDFIQQLTD